MQISLAKYRPPGRVKIVNDDESLSVFIIISILTELRIKIVHTGHNIDEEVLMSLVHGLPGLLACLTQRWMDISYYIVECFIAIFGQCRDFLKV